MGLNKFSDQKFQVVDPHINVLFSSFSGKIFYQCQDLKYQSISKRSLKGISITKWISELENWIMYPSNLVSIVVFRILDFKKFQYFMEEELWIQKIRHATLSNSKSIRTFRILSI